MCKGEVNSVSQPALASSEEKRTVSLTEALQRQLPPHSSYCVQWGPSLLKVSWMVPPLLPCTGVIYLWGGGLKYTAYSFIHLSAGQIFVETLRIQTMHQGLFCNGEQDGSGLLSSRSFRGGTSKRQQSAGRGRVWHSVTAHYRPGPRYACVSSSVLLNNSPVLQMRKKKRYLPKVTG